MRGKEEEVLKKRAKAPCTYNLYSQLFFELPHRKTLRHSLTPTVKKAREGKLKAYMWGIK